MQDRIAARHVNPMLHDLPHILLVTMMQQAASREAVLLQDFEEDLDRCFVE